MGSTQVMPVKVSVLQTRKLTGDDTALAEYYTRDDLPLFSMKNDSPYGRAVEFSEDLYCELISIASTEEASSFIAKYPFLRFAFADMDLPGIGIKAYDTLEHYCEMMVEAISVYNDFRLYEVLRQRELLFPSPEWHPQMLQIYKKHFRLLNTDSHWSSLQEYEEQLLDRNNKVDAVVEKMMERGLSSDEDYKELENEYFEGRNELRQQHRKEVQEHVAAMIDAKMQEDISRYINKINSLANVVYDSDSLVLECRCQTLLTAMYMMLFVSLHNNDEYRLCSHPKCHTYYRVDKTHPQSMCDRHMAARRRKRINFRLNHPEDEIYE